jgi:hypothetical protein
VTVTVPASGRVVVTITAHMLSLQDEIGVMSFASTGGSGNVFASSSTGLRILIPAGKSLLMSATFPVTGLSPGSHTFTAKYQSNGGETVLFAARSIIVIPLP